MLVFFRRTQTSRFEPLACALSGRTKFDQFESCYRGNYLMRVEGCWEVKVVDDQGQEWARFYRNENGAVVRDGGIDT